MQYLRAALIGWLLWLATALGGCYLPTPPTPKGPPEAAVLRYEDDTITCTAFAIGPTTAITAAHCVNQSAKSGATVLLTGLDGSHVALEGFTAPTADIAMLRVDPPFTKHLDTGAVALFPQDVLVMCGYGPGKYRCLAGYYLLDDPLEGDIVSTLDVVHGDSGSPVLYHNKVVGVAVTIGDLRVVGLDLRLVSFATPVQQGKDWVQRW